MTAPEIIDKLRPKLRAEGLEVDFVNQEGPIVNIRAKRISPGVPVAFLVKAIAGTYRRYLPEIEDVCLTEYDPGESIGTAPSPTFQPVFEHQPVAAGLAVLGLPIVDLSGLDRRQAVQALESFFRVWKSKSPLLGVEGLTEDAPRRAMEKWASVYRDDYTQIEEVSPNRRHILVRNDAPESISEILERTEERMPGKIFLLVEDGK